EEEEEPSEDEADNEEEHEDDEEEEEHLAPTDSTTVAFPVVDHVPSAEETESFETDESAATPPPHPAYHIPSPPLPPILSPLPVSPPLPVSSLPLPASPTYPMGYRAAMIWLRAETPSTSHLLPSTSVFEVILPPRKRLCFALGPRYEVDESSSAPTRGLKADYGFVGNLDDEIRRDPERYVSYGITDTWEDMVEDIHG
ncbi:hypothetical protein Tco_1012861, partial [Tanacetum coccineum]